jgi:hypothetical protein
MTGRHLGTFQADTQEIQRALLYQSRTRDAVEGQGSRWALARDLDLDAGFASFFVGEKDSWIILLRLSVFLRNVLAACGPLITPGHGACQTLWPALHPSLCPGHPGKRSE